jgi:hypothetical protein
MLNLDLCQQLYEKTLTNNVLANLAGQTLLGLSFWQHTCDKRKKTFNTGLFKTEVSTF